MAQMVETLILGAGLAGLGAGYKLREHNAPALLIEKNAYAGGHATTFEIDGFHFDEGPHVSFTKSEIIRELFAKACDGAPLEYPAKLTNYWRGHWVRHPAQTNLYGLPKDVIDACIADFKKETGDKRELKNYHDWCVASFGKYFAENFPALYTRKYWTVELEDMTASWIGQRLHRPTLEEMLEGAAAPNTKAQNYISMFRYPAQGGFKTFPLYLAKNLDIHFNTAAVSIDPAAKTVRLKNGDVISYNHLISSLPMDALLALLPGVPGEIKKLSDDLLVTAATFVSIGVKSSRTPPDFHWAYVYDEDLLPARISAPHTLSPSMAPKGCFSLQAEVYSSRNKPLPAGDIAQRVTQDLRRMKLLQDGDEILFTDTRTSHYANVAFTHAREAAVPRIKAYLETLGIQSCGRYGDWGSHWSDESVLSGFREANRVLP